MKIEIKGLDIYKLLKSKDYNTIYFLINKIGFDNFIKEYKEAIKKAGYKIYLEYVSQEEYELEGYTSKVIIEELK